MSILVLCFLSGCVVKDMGRTMEHSIKGEYYLTNKKFEQGRSSFAQEVKENPDSSLANYYYGRFLLQNRDYTAAVKYLETAKKLAPDKADHYFWTGIAYAGLGKSSKEAQNYLKALEIDPAHLQSLIYMGHIRLARKKYWQAAEYYDMALEIWPECPSALYNRALIAKHYGRTPEEQVAWLEYLSLYPSGKKARKATDHLNASRDFTFRNHTLGRRTVTTEKIYFEPLSAIISRASYESLDLVGGIFQNMDRGKLQVVVYQKNNKQLARDRAMAIKQYLVNEFPDITPADVGASWFSTPQKIKIKKKTVMIDESVSFFISTR